MMSSLYTTAAMRDRPANSDRVRGVSSPNAFSQFADRL